MDTKYRLFCESEGIWVTTDWLSESPTECPNGSGHVIDVDSITSFQSASSNDILLSIGGNSGEFYYECDSSYWEVIRKFQFRGTNILGDVKSCSIIADVENSDYPGEYRLYDITNDNFIASWIVTSETFETHINYDLDNIPENPATFEIHGKSSSAYETGLHTKITTFLMEFI